jgi:hypothetical protein
MYLLDVDLLNNRKNRRLSSLYLVGNLKKKKAIFNFSFSFYRKKAPQSLCVWRTFRYVS